jgi:hypothetical protein
MERERFIMYISLYSVNVQTGDSENTAEVLKHYILNSHVKF